MLRTALPMPLRLTTVYLAIASGVVGCTPAAPRAPDPNIAPTASDMVPDSLTASVIYPHARIRMQLPARPGTWYIGEAGAMTAPDGRVQCLVWAVAPPAPSGLRFPPIYSFTEMARAQLSERYPGEVPGRRRSVYRAGADTTGERWLEIPEAARRAAAEGC